MPVLKSHMSHDNQTIVADDIQKESARETNRHSKSEMHIPSVTQVRPEDAMLRGEKIYSDGTNDTPSQKELEQDVIATNPSVDSMQSRG